MKLLMILLTLSLVATGVFAGGAAEEEQQLNLRYAEQNPEGDSITIAAEEFARIVEDRTDGRITIDIHSGGTLGNHDEVISGLQTGAIEMGRTQYGYLAEAGWPRLAVFSLPFIWRDIDHARDVLTGPVGEDTLVELEDQLGLIGLGHLVTYPRNFFFTDEPVTSLDQMAGMAVRVQPGDLYLNMVEALGADATAIDFGELYSALQSGIVDGAEQPPKGYVANQFQEITNYFVLTRHQIDPSVMLVSPTIWNQLTEDDQQLFRDAAAEARQHYIQVAAEEQDEALDEMRAAGVEVLELDNPQEWQDAVTGIYDNYPDDQDLIQAIIDG